MSHLRLRIKLNKGQRGIPLEKLAAIVAETRKFLIATSQDIEILNPESWIGVDFRNGSLLYTNESATEVSPAQVHSFNQSLTHLSRGRFPTLLQQSTVEHFYGIFETLEPREKLTFGIFPDDSSRAKWLTVTREVALLPSSRIGLAVRESIGALQGSIHTWFKMSEPPYFTLRDLATQALVKCFYEDSDYDAVVQAVRLKNQVIHVHGRIFTDMVHHCIDHVEADRIVPAESFTFNDLENYLGTGKVQ